MRFDVLTLFPRIFDGFLSESLLEKAIEKKLAEVVLHDFREWTTDSAPSRKRPSGNMHTTRPRDSRSRMMRTVGESGLERSMGKAFIEP